jgi:hypothetical protein
VGVLHRKRGLEACSQMLQVRDTAVLLGRRRKHAGLSTCAPAYTHLMSAPYPSANSFTPSHRQGQMASRRARCGALLTCLRGAGNVLPLASARSRSGFGSY